MKGGPTRVSAAHHLLRRSLRVGSCCILLNALRAQTSFLWLLTTCSYFLVLHCHRLSQCCIYSLVQAVHRAGSTVNVACTKFNHDECSPQRRLNSAAAGSLSSKASHPSSQRAARSTPSGVSAGPILMATLEGIRCLPPRPTTATTSSFD